ncbi:hypothetical protein CGCF413_v015014 [Colletotrichum fructicola]|nr:hypothetical protein CGCF413_v015014 [Colletotrichum fructicola]
MPSAKLARFIRSFPSMSLLPGWSIGLGRLLILLTRVIRMLTVYVLCLRQDSTDSRQQKDAVVFIPGPSKPVNSAIIAAESVVACRPSKCIP